MSRRAFRADWLQGVCRAFARYSTAAALSRALVVIACVALVWAGAWPSFDRETFGFEDTADPVRTEATGGAVPAGARGVLTAIELNAEQRRIAEHVAEKFRLSLDAVGPLVAMAYAVSEQSRLDPMLLLAVISVESGFNPLAQSARGAQGLMQIHMDVHAERFAVFGGDHAAFDPWANMWVGATLLKMFLLREGSVEAALKAYVGAAYRRHDGGYGARVLAERDRLQQAARAPGDIATDPERASSQSG